jgi:hypothetical protein
MVSRGGTWGGRCMEATNLEPKAVISPHPAVRIGPASHRFYRLQAQHPQSYAVCAARSDRRGAQDEVGVSLILE